MDVNELQVRLLHAAKTKDQWKVVTSYPKKGEVCLEAITSTGATSFKIKIGDGTRPYCRNTGTPESPIWDFTSDQVLPYFGTTVVTDGTVSVVSIGTYTEGSSIKKKLVFYPLSLASSTVEGVTTLSPVLDTAHPYLEVREGTGIEFTVDETGTPKLLNINISSSYLNDTITSAINALDTPSPLNLAEWDSSTNTLSLYSLSETNGIVSKSSTAIATIDLSGIAPVQDVQVNSTSILSNGVADITVDGIYDSSTNKIATESTVSSAVADLDVAGYGQATIDTTTSNQTTLTVKGIKEDDGKIAADSTQDVNIVMDGTYNASYNKVATQTTVSNAINSLDGLETTVNTTSSTDVITTVSETNGVVSSTKKTIVEGNKIDINVPTTGTSTGDIIISHEDIDTTAADVASTITTDSSSTVDEKELNVITGIKVDAQGHITHIDKDKSTNLVASDIKGSVSVTDDSAWIYRPTGGTISIGEDIAKVNGLEGNSAVWNQIIKNGHFSMGMDYWNARGSTIVVTVENNVATINLNSVEYGGITTSPNTSIVTSGHKYYVRFYAKASSNITCYNVYYHPAAFNETPTYVYITQTWSKVSKIITAKSNAAAECGLRTASATPGNTILYLKDAIMVDLTLLGIDNLTTVAEVEEWLAEHVGTKPYYAYNTGTILSAQTLGFNTYGQNLLNPTTKQARLVTYTDTTNSNKYTIKNIPENTTVTYTPYNTGTSVDVTSLIENDTFDITSYGDGILELSAVADDTYVCIKWDGTKDDDIVPYEEHNYNFDVTKVYGRVNDAGEYVQCYPDGMKSAGSVHDTLTASEAVSKIGSVDSGDLGWYYSDNNGSWKHKLFIAPMTDIAFGNRNKVVCPKYGYSSSSFTYSDYDKTIYFAVRNEYIYIRDDSYTDATTFRSAMSGVMLYYELATPITYTDLIYSEDGGQTGTPLKKVLLTMNVNDWGTEEQALPNYVDNNPTSVPANVVIEYKSNFKEAVLETIDKVNSYKNPVRGANDTPQTTGKVAVYDSDSTVKSSTYEISNNTIDPEDTSNETTIPTVDAVVDYVEDVVSTEVTVKDITTTDDDTSGNGGIRVTNSGTTYDVHHADITQTDTTKQTSDEVIANVVTNVTVDSFGHVKGKEVISSDKLIAADIKAPVKQTDNTTWNHRITGGDINIGEDIAKIPVLKGNTIVWNQLVDSSASSVTLTSGNKYYTVIGGTKSIQTGAGTAVSVTGGTDIVIDLTKMFGSGNEPSTVEAFEKLFSNSYYEYNEGELVSLGGYNEPDEELWVDMGLPSGTLWAKSNIDVTQPNGFAASPYQYGCTMFSWGNTEGHNTPASGTTFDYNWGSANAQEPWYEGQPYGSTKGNTLQKDIPEGKEFDAARANLGNLWKEPKSAEFKELINNCDFIDASGNIIPASTSNKIVTVNGILGLYLQSKTNGNRLFFACSGYGNGSSWLYRSAIGYYWSASFYSARDAQYLYFDIVGLNPQYNSKRCLGFAVRPVLNKQDKFGIKSTGFNQWDEEWELGGLNSSTGRLDPDTDRIRSKNFYKCFPNTAYYGICKTSGVAVFKYWYDINKKYISRNAVEITTSPTNAYYFKIMTYGGNYTTYNNDICINISDPVKNGTYEPYKQDTLDLSWIKDIKDSNDNQLFPYGLLSAGSVYDEVTESKAIKRIGSVDLGTLDWGKDAQNRMKGLNDIGGKYLSNSVAPNILCTKYERDTSGNTYLNVNDKRISLNSSSNPVVYDSVYTDAATFKAAMSGVMLYYELATPVEVDIVPAKNMSYLVNDLGTETQLPVNPVSTPITAPFVGTFEYKSNFKDTVIDLIDKVNNAANPVKGINNTDQTVGKIAVYDSVRTTHSSNYSASNATIVEGATGNDIILPAVETIVNYVNSKLSSALTYKGTISEWSDLPTSGQSTGDMYIADTTFTESGVTYQAGDFFIWNGTGWDIVSGTTSVVNSNPTLNLDGGTYQVGTVDGVALQVTTPDLDCSSPTASGTSLEYIDTVSQTNGLLSATKKSIPNASSSQIGVVTLSTGIENTTTEDSKVPTAYDTLTNLNSRDVASGTITDDIATLSKRMLDEDSTSPTWINKTFYPTTKFAAINDFSTGFATNYPDLAKIENITTDGDSSTTPVTLPNTGFLKRTYNSTTGVIDWELTDDTGKMKWLDEVTNTYTYSAASTNLEELGSYIHNYYGITSIEKAVLDNNNYGFRIDVPILSSNTATLGTVLKGTKTTGVTTLPIWGQLGIEELDELDNLGSNTGYLKRKAGTTAGTYEWELSTPASTTVATTKNDGTETTPSSTAGPGIKVTTNGTTAYHKVPFSAIGNDDSTGANAVTIILNGNFN